MMPSLGLIAMSLVVPILVLIVFWQWYKKRHPNRPKRIAQFRRRRRHKKFVKAYKILRKEADRHKAAGHMMDFRAVNESMLIMQCTACPDFHTQATSRRRVL